MASSESTLSSAEMSTTMDFTSTTATPTTTSLSPTPTPSPLPPAQEQIYDSWGLFILVALLFVTLIVAYFLKARRIRSIHETVVSVILGLFVGLVIRLSPGDEIQQVVTFDHRIFFTVLLPPIILESGYGMKVKQFFSNLGSIITFAFLGTLTSTVFCGVLIYLFALTGIHSLHMTFMDCFTFGAILSSTDPVTVLAVFKQLGVDPKLYAIVFGESVLNDSVAIVLFSTLDHFKSRKLSVSTFFEGTGLFLGVFMGSLFTGILFALTCSLLLKHTRLYLFPALESCIVTLIAYGSYLFANGLKLSGIVSLLFCGIMLKHYAYGNLSEKSRRTTRYMYGVLAQLSENFVFVYLGIAVCTVTDGKYAWGLIVFTWFVLLVARYVSVIPCAHLINAVTERMESKNKRRGPLALTPKAQIPPNYQMMIWWAGLRGAISFALSYEVDSPDAGPVIRTTTLIVCVLSIIVLGGTCVRALERYKIRIGVGKAGSPRTDDGLGDEHSSDEEDLDDDDDGNENEPTEGSTVLPRQSNDDFDDESALLGRTGGDERPRISYASDSVAEASNWFVSFDDKWLKPIFTRDGGRIGWGNVSRLLDESDFGTLPRNGRSRAGPRHLGAGSRLGTTGADGPRVTVSVEPSASPKPKGRLFGLVGRRESEAGREDFVDVNGNAVTESTRRSSSVTRAGKENQDGSRLGENGIGRGTRFGSVGAINSAGGAKKGQSSTLRTSVDSNGQSSTYSGGTGLEPSSTKTPLNAASKSATSSPMLPPRVPPPSSGGSSPSSRPLFFPAARAATTSNSPFLSTSPGGPEGGGSSTRASENAAPMDLTSEADEWGELVTAPRKDVFGWMDGL